MLTFSLQKIKSYLGLSINYVDHDELINDLFEYVCADVQQFIRFDLSGTEYTDEIHIIPAWQRNLRTKAFPVIIPDSGDVISMSIHGTDVDTDDFNYDPDGNILFKSTASLDYGYHENHVLLTYTAGYEVFPQAAEMAIYKLIKLEYEERGNNLKSTGDGSLSEVKRGLIGNYPPDVFRILNSFRRNVA